MKMDVKAHSVIYVIESRNSCRSYKNKVLSWEVKSQLLEYMGDIRAGPFGTKSRFKLGAYHLTEDRRLIADVICWMFFPSIMISDVDKAVYNSLMKPHKYPGI